MSKTKKLTSLRKREKLLQQKYNESVARCEKLDGILKDIDNAYNPIKLGWAYLQDIIKHHTKDTSLLRECVGLGRETHSRDERNYLEMERLSDYPFEIGNLSVNDLYYHVDRLYPLLVDVCKTDQGLFTRVTYDNLQSDYFLDKLAFYNIPEKMLADYVADKLTRHFRDHIKSKEIY